MRTTCTLCPEQGHHKPERDYYTKKEVDERLKRIVKNILLLIKPE